MEARSNYSVTYMENEFDKDIEYIANDKICKIGDNNYMKYSTVLKAITILSFTRDTFIKYWTKYYKSDTNKLQQIKKACNKKLDTGLLSLEEMKELVENSDDKTADKENALNIIDKAIEKIRK